MNETPRTPDELRAVHGQLPPNDRDHRTADEIGRYPAREWLEIPAHDDEYNPFPVGQAVQVRYGTRAGWSGTVARWGRGKDANDRFRENESSALLAGRKLTGDDYECLIDAEGPVVRWSDHTETWYPGQSMSVLDPV